MPNIEVIARKRAYAQSRVAIARATDERAEFCALGADTSRTLREAHAMAILSVARMGRVAKRGMRGAALASVAGYVALASMLACMGSHALDNAARSMRAAHVTRMLAECTGGPIVRADNRADVVALLAVCEGVK